MVVYGIKNCNTMKKVFDFLDSKGVAYVFHDYKKAGITRDKLNQWLSSMELSQLINTKGTTYKKLADDDKARMQHASIAIELLMQHTSMIKRPIAETNNQLLIGLDEIRAAI
jgi:arsenate reductase